MRVDEFELAQQPPPITSDFANGRLLMQSPFTTFRVLEVLNRIGDVTVFSPNPGSFEGAIEKLPRGPNERVAQPVFLVTWLLADKSQTRAYRTFAQYRSCPAMHHRFGCGDNFVQLREVLGCRPIIEWQIATISVLKLLFARHLSCHNQVTWKRPLGMRPCRLSE
jgi:hypothetical protein